MAVVHTCGICEMIIDEKNISTHGCMEAYNQLFVDNFFKSMFMSYLLNEGDQPKIFFFIFSFQIYTFIKAYRCYWSILL